MIINSLGRFLFTQQEEDPDRVWIQIMGDGEGGAFLWKDVPGTVREALNKIYSQKELELATDAMVEFWKINF